MHDDTEPLSWAGITVQGPEAETFLQGQLSQDLRTVGPDGSWSLLLTPNSIVLTSCFVTRGDDRFLVVVPRSLGEVALARLRRFLLRTACALELSDTSVGPILTLGDQVRAGQPGPAEFARELTPQCFGQSLLTSSVSFTKGCFTGQELVARLDARGASVPWRLVRFEGASVTAVQEVLTEKGPEGPSGVTTAVKSGELVHGLGFIHRSAFDGVHELRRGDVSVEAIG